MLNATGPDGLRIAAEPHAKGSCPTCDERVIPKCGPLVTWHWAHTSSENCDPWSEPITAWHRDWQMSVPIERREVVIGPHRADSAPCGGHGALLQADDLRTWMRHGNSSATGAA